MDQIKLQPKNIFGIITEGTQIYLKNFIPLSRAMLFPVFGVLLSFILMIVPINLLVWNINRVFPKEVISNYILLVLLILIITILPGLFVFFKAFWEFTISMVSLNSMVEEIVRTGQIKNFLQHNNLIKSRAKDYIVLLFYVAIIWLVGLMLPYPILFLQVIPNIPDMLAAGLFVLLEIINIFILLIISNYICLSFQIFAFGPISPISILKKSFNLIQGNFLRTFFLGFILAIITSIIFPAIIQLFVTSTNLISIINYPFKTYVATLANNPDTLKMLVLGNPGSLALFKDPINDISQFLSLSTVGMVITAFMLPLGSACYTLLYYDILNRKNLNNKKN